ncbi:MULTISPECIES: MFS transporter [Mycolicibacterium]|uniref:MFS transporter n=2 Tax=Mycolicibacterium TaxID=1866885 RepID=A0ABT8HPS4_MYCAO|nr:MULTISPECIES: MFS transporter [Mycolicibacterium]MCV7131108.1 MFS transporter [Mycolicibacterium vanbaalenii PYR-1]MDN4522762.1 MFS transporter [Mycolicibacterium austroafricanum]QRZ06890.1 MFS transporter [Mycolicibacterium austroafricanum]QZT56973.1 MFS transporter [Mycolicibacterium austroafricanum]QZT68372.1 MFS transporter [Mycolicibacterium austroafricanum]
MPTTHEDPPPGVLKKAISASAIGNATEWFDYGIYAYGVSYISAAIFPGDAANATLLALMTFAVSFLVRPLGGFVWGPLGDRLGRKRVLAITIVLMAGATFCVALVPTYDMIGMWAPFLLVLLRMIQGFSTGGEYGGAATFMAEYAPNRRRGLLGSFLEFGTLGGFSLGALLMLGCSLVLGDEQMHAWGWRLPFLVAAPLGLIGLYLRSRLEDTPVFRELEAKGGTEPETTTQFRDLLGRYWRPILQLGGLVVALNVVNYTLLSYMPTYLENRIGLSPDQSLIVPVIGMLSMMVFVPFAGLLSDRVGRKPLWWFSLIGLFVAGVPMFLLMGTNLWGAVIGFAVLGLLYVPQLATISATFPAMFPTQVRYAGFAIAYNVSTSLFGGTAPAINQWLTGETGDLLFPAYYMMGACVIGAIALIKVPETARCPIGGTVTPGTEEAADPVPFEKQNA